MWIVIKVVVNTGAPPVIGCMVGPFETEIAAEEYAAKATIGSLGYENWVIQPLEKAKF